jgi:hypothetical protein
MGGAQRVPLAPSPLPRLSVAPLSKATGRFVLVFGVVCLVTVAALGYAYGNWLVGVLGTCMLPFFVLFLWWGWTTHP